MSKKPLIITENDRRSILSMYGLLTEEVVSNVVISGKVIDKETNPIIAKITLLNVEDNKYITTTDESGQFKLEIPSLEEGDYLLGIKHNKKDLEFSNIELTIKKDKNSYPLGVISPILATQNLKEVKTVLNQLTNITLNVLYNKEPLNDYTLKITPKLNIFEILFESKMNIYNPSLSFFKGGAVFENLVENQKYNKDIITGSKYDFFFFNPGSKEQRQIRITIKNEKIGTLSQVFVIDLGNASTKLVKEDDSFIKNSSSTLDVKINNKNEIIFSINKPTLELKIYDEITGDVIPNAEVKIKNLDKIFNTDKNGLLVIKNLETNKLNLSVGATNYLESFKKINLDDDVNNVEIGLTKFDISGEILDKYKDNIFTIYGRARTDLGYDEALRIAKLDIVNKYLEKHKNRYKNVPKFENVDLDIETENVYHKPQKGETGKTVLIVKSKKKDIRDFLREYTKEEDIEVESEPLVFEDGDIKEALGMAYRYGKNLFVVLGLMDDENTTNIFAEINKNQKLVNYINKNSDLLFVPVDKKNKNYNYLIEKNVRIDRYPSLVVLQPKDLLGNNFDVIKNDQYFNPKTYFSKK